MKNFSDVDIESIIKNIEVNGFAIVKGFLDDHEVKKSLDLIKNSEKFDAPNKTSDVVFGLTTYNKWFIELVDSDDISKVFMHFLNDPHFGVIEESLPNYIIGYALARSSGKALPTHIDSYVPSQGKYPIIMSGLIALENQTQLNGNTYLIPKSHQSSEYPDQSKEYPETLEIFSQSGDLVIWDSRLWHGSRENISGNTRWALIYTFMRWWIKPRLDSTKNISQEYYDSLNNRQKALLGFCSVAPSDPRKRIVTRVGFKDLPSNVLE